jgi:hypothetical protein
MEAEVGIELNLFSRCLMPQNSKIPFKIKDYLP